MQSVLGDYVASQSGRRQMEVAGGFVEPEADMAAKHGLHSESLDRDGVSTFKPTSVYDMFRLTAKRE